MSKKTLFDIKQVQETSSQSEANRFLELGWTLIDTYTTSLDDQPYKSMVYVLGWVSDDKPINPFQ